MADTIILTNALLIDGRGGDPVPNTSVGVSGTTIQAILPAGPTSRDARFDDLRIVDLLGRPVIQGLIDAHVHPGNVEGYLHVLSRMQALRRRA